MKDLSIYFSPIESPELIQQETLGHEINVHTENGFPEFSTPGIALVYVPEFRNGKKEFQGQSEANFRAGFYNFFKGANWRFSIYDLGDLLPGERVEDTYFALSQVVSELIKVKVVPIVIGGSQDLTYAMYTGYETLEQMVNVLSIDNRLDLGDPEKSLHADGFVSQLLMRRPCYLFNYAVLGYQTPLVKASELDLFEKLFFDTVRYGEFLSDFKVAEPHLRNSDLVTIDVASIKASEFKGEPYCEPNGFTNQEMCQIARYAGISDKLSSFGLFNLYPGVTAPSAYNQIAQMIWYFADGYANRVGDFPMGTKKDYTKFTVFLDEIDHEIIFYKSNRSDRWWMEVPYPSTKGAKYERHHMVPCHKNQYDNALKGEIPDLWWKTFQKLG